MLKKVVGMGDWDHGDDFQGGAFVVSAPMELCGTWIWSQCCSCAIIQTSLEIVALEVDVLRS